MARKVFISFLGTGNYVQTSYIMENGTSKPVRFVQEAILDSLENILKENCKVYIFCTEKANELNWVDGGHKKPIEEVEKIGLESVLKTKSYYSNVEKVTIPEGFSTEEIREIFDIVYSHLEEGDKLYFDVTHAFRSIPMFSTVLFNYSQFMKNTKLVKVFYGAFEKLGPAYEVRNLPIEQRVAPILDLSEMIQLQQLTQLTYDLKEYGKIGDMSNAFCSPSSNNKFKMIIMNLQKASSKLQDYIATNRVKQIEEGAFVKDVEESIKSVLKNPNTSSAQMEIVRKIQEEIASFRINGGKQNIIAAVDWAKRYDMIQQAYTLAQELIITLGTETFCEFNSYSEPIIWRNFISALFAISDKDIETEKFDGVLADDIDLTKHLLSTDKVQAVRKSYSAIAGNRNILSHGKRGNLTLSDFKKQLEKHFPVCLKELYVD